MKQLLIALLLCGAAIAGAAENKNELSLDALLEAVKSGRLAESQANSERLEQFRNTREMRQQMLEEIIAEERRQEAISEHISLVMDQTWNSNQGALIMTPQKHSSQVSQVREINKAISQQPCVVGHFLWVTSDL